MAKTNGRMIAIHRYVVVLAVVATASSLPAQEQAPETPARVEPSERSLDEHVFLSPVFMPTPFLSTHFQLRQGLTQVTVDDFPVTENTRLDVQLLGLSERIEAGVRFLDLFEVFGFATGELLSGSSGRSVVAAGSSFLYTGGLGGRVRLFRSERSGTELTVRVEGSTGRGGLLDILRLADTLADDPNLTFEAIAGRRLGDLVLSDTSRSEVVGHLLAAQALGRNFELQGAVGVAYYSLDVELYNPQTNSETTRETSSVGPLATVAFGANLTPLVPIGFMLEYAVQSDRYVLAGSDDAEWTNPSHLVGLGIHNVHPNFQIGLTFARLMNVEPISTVDPFTGQTLTSDRPAVSYVQLGMEVSW